MTDTARRILLGILLLGLAGVSLELLLLGHVEDFYQLVPLVLAALAAVAVTLVVVRPTGLSVRLFQIVMVSLILSGALGMFLHFQVNLEFQLEMDPALTGMPLYQKAILAKTPPALAPGSMVQLGLIGLAYTFRHPAHGGPR